MKILARAAAALALLSFAAPALPCSDHAVKTAKTEKKSTTVAKSGAKVKKAAAPAKASSDSKPATAAN